MKQTSPQHSYGFPPRLEMDGREGWELGCYGASLPISQLWVPTPCYGLPPQVWFHHGLKKKNLIIFGVSQAWHCRLVWHHGQEDVQVVLEYFKSSVLVTEAGRMHVEDPCSLNCQRALPGLLDCCRRAPGQECRQRVQSPVVTLKWCVFYIPCVAEAVLQSPLSFIHQLIHALSDLLVQIFCKHCQPQTGRARELKF